MSANINLIFNTFGNEKQKIAASKWMDSTTTEIVYGGSKGSGKSYLGVSMVFGEAMLYKGTSYFIARKTGADLLKHTIPSVHEVFRHWGLVEGLHYTFKGVPYNYFELYNPAWSKNTQEVSRVYLLACKYLPSDPLYSRFGSMQMTKGWIEEAGEFDEEAKNSLFATVGRWKNDEYGLCGKVLQTCNPAKNYLYKNFYIPNKNGELAPHLSFIQAYPTDNKRLPKEYLEGLERTLNENEKQRLLYGNWEFDTDRDALIDYKNIINCFSNDYVQAGNPPNNRYLTADVARKGKDSTIIGVWDGYRLEKYYRFNGLNVNEVVRQIRTAATEFDVPQSNWIVDEDGIGGGVVDNLGCNGFVNNSSPLPNPKTHEPENYRNLRSQCYFKLAQMINDNQLFFNVTSDADYKMIREELEQVRQKDVDAIGKRDVVGRDYFYSKLGRSPDWASMLMMRMWFEYKPKSQNFAAFISF